MPNEIGLQDIEDIKDIEEVEEIDTTNAWGLTDKEAEKVKDFVPRIDVSKMPVGSTVSLRLLQDEPVDFEWEDKDTKEKVVTKTLNAIDQLTGLEVSVWLSSKSLRQEFFKLAKQLEGKLKGQYIVIAVREYDHEKYGTTRAYTVQVDRKAEGFGVNE